MKRTYSFALSRISSMLDMGGAGAPQVNTRIDVSKNNKVRSIGIDFDLIWRSVQERKQQTSEHEPLVTTTSPQNPKPTNIGPDLQLIESISQLFQLKRHKTDKNDKRDDVSRIVTFPPSAETPAESPLPPSTPPSHFDIRTKYASKLRSKVEGGIPALENMKLQREEAIKKGDASTHLFARNVSLSHPSPNQWIATQTGSGKLLHFLNHRCMRIAFLPSLQVLHIRQRQDMHQRMKDLGQQLPHVHIELTISGLEQDTMEQSRDAKEMASHVIHYVQSQIQSHPNSIIVVSDREEYLRAAKDQCMLTCRVRSANGPRGNVTTHYTVEDISEVENVINEINGISFNTVLSRTN